MGSGALSNMQFDQGGGTLPRHRGSSTNLANAQRPRPIAKVIGNVSMTLQQQQQQLLSNSSDYVNEKNSKVNFNRLLYIDSTARSTDHSALSVNIVDQY